MKRQSCLTQWHVLDVIQTAAAEEWHTQYKLQLKSSALRWSRCPFMRWMREMGEADWEGEEAESVMVHVYSSLWEYARESEGVS